MTKEKDQDLEELDDQPNDESVPPEDKPFMSTEEIVDTFRKAIQKRPSNGNSTTVDRPATPQPAIAQATTLAQIKKSLN